MARSRNIKPGFYKNEDLAECSVWARFIFPGLWMMADREGRLEDRPKRIKAELLPFDSHDVEPLLRELENHGFIVRYEAEGERYIQVTKFKKHQTPHYSEKKSAIKPHALQENERDVSRGNSGSDGGINESEHQESSGSDPGIKRGSQPSDSLIPDSLIPESLQNQRPRGARARRSNGEEKFERPEWVPAAQWEAWIEARTKKRNAPTEWAKELAVAKLEELKEQGHHPAQVLAQSAFHGWAGLFPVKA